MENVDSIVTKSLKDRKTLIEVLVGAIVLALGVHLVAAGIEKIWDSPIVLLSLGFVITIIPSALMVRQTLGGGQRLVRLEGILPTDIEKKKISPLWRYEFSESIQKYLEASFKENQTFERDWMTDPFLKCDKSKQILKEASEYFVLSNLSSHLESYFNQRETGSFVELSRKDLLPILEGNRFLALFSKPIHERTGFTKKEGDSWKDTTVASVTRISEAGELLTHARSEDGAIFDAFRLSLPVGSSVRRVDGNVVISTKRFDLTISIPDIEYQTTLPRGFRLIQRTVADTDVQKISVNLVVKFRWYAFWLQRGWQQHKWVESFLSSLEEAISPEKYYKRTGIPQAITILGGLAQISNGKDPGSQTPKDKPTKQETAAPKSKIADEPTSRVESTPAAPSQSIQIGSRVFHSKFGAGTVTGIFGKEEKRMASVMFDSGDERSFSLKYANLRSI